MAIIITKNGKNAKKISSVTIKDEEYLQRYINDNPECVPLDELQEEQVNFVNVEEVLKIATSG